MHRFRVLSMLLVILVGCGPASTKAPDSRGPAATPAAVVDAGRRARLEDDVARLNARIQQLLTDKVGSLAGTEFSESKEDAETRKRAEASLDKLRRYADRP